MIVGAVTVMFSLPAMLDGANARCHLARARVNQANTDRRDWNDVDTGGKKAKDLSCADAARLYEQIRVKENGDRTLRLPSESTIENQNLVAVVMGVGQAVSGFLVLRSASRTARYAAIAFSALGLFLAVLDVLSIAVFGFVLYAFAFTPASRELWPKEPR
jgi:hypothetical protein